jgi:hypothetical protein
MAAAFAALRAYNVHTRSQSVLGVLGGANMHNKSNTVTGHRRHTSHVTRHTSHVTRHTSHVTRHTSNVTRHTSHVTPPLTIFITATPAECSLSTAQPGGTCPFTMKPNRGCKYQARHALTPTAHTNSLAPLWAMMSMSSGSSPLV